MTARLMPYVGSRPYQVLHALLADGVVEKHELPRVETAIYCVVQALNEMAARRKGMAKK